MGGRGVTGKNPLLPWDRGPDREGAGGPPGLDPGTAGAPPRPGSRTFRVQRLRWVWLLALPYLLLADPSSTSLLAGSLVALPGLALRAWAAGFILKERELATRGPFGLIRHPLYAGSFLVGSGLALAGGRWWFVPVFVVLFVWIYRRTLLAEDRTLRRLFGSEYLAYRDQVPAFLPVPGSGAETRAPMGGFMLGRYLRNKEWEAALGVGAGFGLLLWKLVWMG